jgi:HPt (histidine-containing phosphotransfer) domain-containing protein
VGEADEPSTLALIRAAHAEFRLGLVAKSAALDGWVSRAAWDDARRAAHKLRGSAGVYGCAALGAIAGELEEALIGSGSDPDAAAVSRIRALLADLHTEAERASQEMP